MTYHVLIAFCVVIHCLIFFDITSKHTKIPGVLLFMLTEWPFVPYRLLQPEYAGHRRYTTHHGYTGFSF
jgi:hypothetical protein